MSDLRTLLHEAAPQSLATPTDSVVDLDVARGRRALRRRRAARVGAGSTLVAAAAVGALAIVGPGGSPTVPSGNGTSTSGVIGSTTSGVRLVAYTGAQPTGFRLDKVPTGWVVRDDTVNLLTLVPAGGTTPESPAGATSLEGTIAVSTQSDSGVPTGVRLDDVGVGGRPAVIAHMEGAGDTRTLFARQASGTYLVIQVWDGLGWDNQRIAEFASSVHVTDAAKPTVG